MLRSLFEKYMKYAIIRAVLLGVLGILMLLFPEPLLKAIVYILAGYVILNGALAIWGYVRQKERGLYGYEFVTGCLLIALGIVMLLFSRQLISVLPVFMGVLMVLTGASYFVNALSDRAGRSWLLIALALVVLIGGIVVIANPFGTLTTLMRVFGVLLLVSCVDELATYIHFRDMTK